MGRVVQETLRLYPPAWGTGRRPIADDVVDGYRLRVGRNTILNFYALHRHPAYWDAIEPEATLTLRPRGPVMVRVRSRRGMTPSHR